MSTVNIGPCKLYYGPQDIRTYLGYTESGVTITVSPLSYSERLDQQNYDTNNIIMYKTGLITANIVQLNLETLNLLIHNTSYTEVTSKETLSFNNIVQSINVSDMLSLKLESMLDNESIICHYVYPIVNFDTVFRYDVSSFEINFQCYNYNDKFIDFA